MRHRTHLSGKERAARSRLVKLLHEEAILCGSVVTMVHTCGNPGCKCARGDKHVSLYLAMPWGGQRKMIYVPWALAEPVRSAVAVHKETRQLLQCVSEACLGRFLKQKEQLSTRRGGQSKRASKGARR